MRLAGARLKKALLGQGITPKMGWSHGELEVKVNGQRVYSYKEEHPFPGDEEVMRRVQGALG